MKRISRDLMLLTILAASLAQGTSAAVTADQVTADQKEPLDTVVIEGTRAQLNLMLQEMVKVEDRFFERYNELNPNHDFDMICFREARVGTRFQRRYCIAKYMNEALATQGQDYAVFLQNNFDADAGTTYKQNNDPPTLLGAPPISSMVMIEARRKDFKQNMRDVVSHNPELLKILRERYELGQRYETTRRKVWGLKPLPEVDKAGPAVPVPP